MFNKVVLLGNLTRDIDLRYSQNNTAIGKTGLAVNRKYTVNGEKREDTCFIDITFWGRSAEVANQYLKKSSKVLIEGRLNYEQWVDQNGQNRSRHSISVENMEMLDSRPQNSDYHPQNTQYNNAHQAQNYGNQAGYGDAGFSHQNSANHGYSNQGGGYGSQNSYQNRPNNVPRQHQQISPEPRYEEKMPEIDVDADLKPASKPQNPVSAGDDDIPF